MEAINQALKELQEDFNEGWKLRGHGLTKGSARHKEARKKYVEENIERLKQFLGKAVRDIILNDETIDKEIDGLIRYLKAIKKLPGKLDMLTEFRRLQASQLPGTLSYHRLYQPHQKQAAERFIEILQKEYNQLHHGGTSKFTDQQKEFLKGQKESGKLTENSISKNFIKKYPNGPKRTAIQNFLKGLEKTSQG